MTQGVWSLGAAVLAGWLCWQAAVDVRADPPAVACVGDWVAGCERVEGGLRFRVEAGAPDLAFTFVGLGEDVALGYWVEDGAGARLAFGAGTSVPLGAWQEARGVRFFALSGEADWAEVEAVGAEAAGEAAAARKEVPGAPGGGGAAARAARGRRTLAGADGFAIYEAVSRTATQVGSDPETGETVISTFKVSALNDICSAGEAPYGENAFSVSVEGQVLVYGGVRIRAGADDTADVSVGDACSSVTGEHAFIWGPWSVSSGEYAGLVAASAAFSTVGGPHDFRMEGLGDWAFYEQVGSIPYATPEVSPAAFTVPWRDEGELEGSVAYGPKDARVTYALSTEGFVRLAEDDAAFVVDREAFLTAGAQPTNAVVRLTQTYDRQAMTNEVAVLLSPATTSLTLSPGSITVSNADDGGSATAEGADEPCLTYALRPDAAGLVRVEGKTAFAGPEILRLRDAWLGQNLTTNATWQVEVPWEASYKGVVVTNDVAELTIEVALESKAREDACDCECAEGTQAEAGCVSFRQAFGRTPRLAGMPQGALAIEAHNLSDGLFTPAALRYDHPMMRRLNRATGVVTDPMGRTVAYGRDGYPVGQDVASDSRLEIAADGTALETFADRSAVEYGQDGRVAALVSPEGVRATPAELGITVAHDAQGRIAQILSEADGSLMVSALSPTAYSVAWADTEGTPVKTFAFSKEGTDTLLLMDGPFPVRWTWVPENHDFAMVRGEGDEAVTTARSVVYDGASVNVAKTVSRGGAVASAETETLDSRNGNAVVGRTVGGRTTLAATRVTTGDGLGRIATRTDERGLTTAFTYDAHGRTLTRTESAPGLDPRVTTYGYAADPLDRRPWFTTERVGGVTTRTASFMEAMDADGGRVEATSDCGLVTTTFHWPATAANRVAAGRVRAVVRPDGRMTTHDYAYDAATGTVTETATEGLDADGYGTFATVDGKSTRTLTTRDARGDAVRIEREALIGGAWVPLAWETRTYNAAHRHVGSAWSNGKSYASAWNCTGPIWEIDTRGIATTNVYDSLKRLVSSTRHGPRGALTTAYTRDAAGRATQTARGGLVSAAAYDTSGRTVSETDEQGRTTAYAYPDAWTTVATLPGGGTRITTLDAFGRVASVTGTAVTPEYHTYGPGWEKIHYGSPDGARWVKTWRDGLGRVTREERAGANGSVLVTEHTYNAKGQLTQTARTGQAPVTYSYNDWGERVATRIGGRFPQSEETAWVVLDGKPWRETVSAVSNLTWRVRVDAEGERQVATDVRGNQTTVDIADTGAWRVVTTQRPGIATPLMEATLDGLTDTTIEASGAIRTWIYDRYGRPIAETDGRGNTLTRAYDALDRLASLTDEAGATTAFAYDEAGRLAAVTNALGNVTCYEYDLRGNTTYAGGAVYPVAYAYDLFGNRTSMTTYRDETGTGDTTAWAYDAATGAVLSKTFADGRGLAHTLTDLGQVATRTDARGTVTAYAYNVYGDLVSQTYSDGTPSVTYEYDALGRQTRATDAAGTTTFTYGAYGELETEAVSGLYAKTLTRHRDALGRDAGYSVDGARQTTIAYDPATGRIAGMDGFAWEYLPGSDLKSKLTYPNGATAEWAYEPHRDLLTRVTNTLGGEVLSRFDYTNDLLGRRTEIGKSGSAYDAPLTETYAYDARNQLISGQGLAYAYDDIGNRTAAEGHAYAANALNQYTAIDAFTPEYDADGNQTLVRTPTGIWSVTYNAEKRPVRWEQGDTVVTMTFDRLGRRVRYHETRAGARYIDALFVYDGYRCVQRLYGVDGVDGRVYQSYVWAPTEPVATRPLKLAVPDWGATLYYAHDGNKNVTDLFYHTLANGLAAHYDYAPFGALTRAVADTPLASRDLPSENPFRFSSEYADNSLALVYYNHRHYNPKDGRWLSRDPIGTRGGSNVYGYADNTSGTDVRGLAVWDNVVDGVATAGRWLGKSVKKGANGLSFATHFPRALLANPPTRQSAPWRIYGILASHLRKVGRKVWPRPALSRLRSGRCWIW